MKLFHEEQRWISDLEQILWPYARLLLGDGWRPLSEYVYDRNYVYAVGVTMGHKYVLFIGRGGKYELPCTGGSCTTSKLRFRCTSRTGSRSPKRRPLHPSQEIFPPKPEEPDRFFRK